MIKQILFCSVLLFSLTSFGQEVQLSLKNKVKLADVDFYGVDKYDAVYYVKKRSLYKKTKDKTYSFSSLQLGAPTGVDFINPLKIVLFYRDANTAVLLDDKLTEITRVDFNRVKDFRTVGFATKANKYGLWIFNEDSQELELFDYKSKSISVKTQPVAEKVLQQRSDFNYCWLLTDHALVSYNNYSSFMGLIWIKNLIDFSFNNHHIVGLKKDRSLVLIEVKHKEITKIASPKIEFSDFYLNGENLYLYDGKYLYRYLINSSK